MKPLPGHAFLRDLDPPLVERLAGCSAERVYEPGALLLREGDRAADFFLLAEGTVALEVAGPEGGRERLETFAAGDVVGLSWLFPPERWHFDARAVDRVRAHVVDARCLREKMDADPAFGYALARRLLLQTYLRMQRARMQRLDLYRDAT